MVDKPWMKIAGRALGVTLATLASYAGMAFVLFAGFVMACGIEQDTPCTSEVAAVLAWVGVVATAVAIAVYAIAWIVRGRGVTAFAWAVAAGFGAAIGGPLLLAATTT